MPGYPPSYSAGSRTAVSFFGFILGGCAAVAGGLLLSDINFSLIFYFLAIIVSVYMAVRFPIVQIVFYMWVVIVPDLLYRLTRDKEDLLESLLLQSGIRIHEILLAGMFAAIAIHAGRKLVPQRPASRRFSPKQKPWLELCIVAFGLWLAVAVARNFDTYGLSTLGELRQEYLELILPVYIALVLNTRQRRLGFFKLFFFHCFFLPLLCLPIIGSIKGWDVGPLSRFYSAYNSLGILIGIIVYLIGSRYNAFKTNVTPFWPALPVALCLIIVDSHRSVWFSGLAMMAVYFYISFDGLRSWRLSSFAMIFFSAMALFFASLATTYILDIQLLEYVIERGDDLFEVGHGYRNTWAWRIEQWEMQLPRIAESPFTGLGFGGYWGLSGEIGDYGVVPHNFYVHTVVKLGIIGFALYFTAMLLIFRKILAGIALAKKEADPELAFLNCGFIALLGSHVYFIAYALSLHCLVLIGLAMAKVYHHNSDKG